MMPVMFHRLYGSSAGLVVNGEWYRCATALLLHADSLHLAGNLVGMAIFATAVCSITGWGVGWLLILASGISGNLINAYAYGYGHSSIGASTAVFGALGLLSSYQFLKKIHTPFSRFQVLLPLGAGLALLAFLGSSSHTDIMAHLFGFLSGVALGLVYYRLVRYPFAWRIQVGALACVVVVLVTAWIRPILGMSHGLFHRPVAGSGGVVGSESGHCLNASGSVDKEQRNGSVPLDRSRCILYDPINPSRNERMVSPFPRGRKTISVKTPITLVSRGDTI